MCVCVCVCLCVCFRPSVKSPSLTSSGAPYGYTTTPPWCLRMLSVEELLCLWCRCVCMRVRVCVRVSTYACVGDGERLFSPIIRLGPVSPSLTNDWVGKRCLNENSISWKSFPCHFGAGCMWCWFEWKYAGSTVKISVYSSLWYLKPIIAFAISIFQAAKAPNKLHISQSQLDEKTTGFWLFSISVDVPSFTAELHSKFRLLSPSGAISNMCP